MQAGLQRLVFLQQAVASRCSLSGRAIAALKPGWRYLSWHCPAQGLQRCSPG
jgi:hypothetical protein